MTLKKMTSLMLLVVCFSVSGQVQVSEFIQASKSSKSNTNRLYFIDFWATWCGPCKTAKEQLGVLQRKFPNNFYAASMSRENPALVERYIKTRPTDLAIVMDYEGNTHKKFGITTYPFGVLLNANGDVLWRGSTPDLSSEIISKFLRVHTKTKSVSSFFQIITSYEARSNVYEPKKDFEIKSSSSTKTYLQITETETYTKISGPIYKIIGHLKQVNSSFIAVDAKYNKIVDMYFKKPISSNKAQLQNILDYYNAKLIETKQPTEALVLNIASPHKLWNTDVINWGGTNKFLVGDSDIKADNVTINEFAYQLSVALDKPVVFENADSLVNNKYDWDVHYKYFQLMQPALEDSFGIIATEQTKTISKYTVKQK